MLGEIFVEKINDIEFVVKEEKNLGVLNIFCDGKLLDTKNIDVKWIVYLSYSEKNSILLGSGYGNGEVFSVGISNNKFTDKVSVFSERDNARRKDSMSHSIVLDVNENYAYSANLGLDKIYIYKVSKDGLQQIGSYDLPEGTGPRHIAFGKNNMMYVVSENSNEMFVFKQDVFSGELELVEHKSILPDDFSGVSYGGTLIVQQDNRFLLTNNRGANTIAVFKIYDDGKINKVADLDYKLFDFYKAKENVYGL